MARRFASIQLYCAFMFVVFGGALVASPEHRHCLLGRFPVEQDRQGASMSHFH